MSQSARPLARIGLAAAAAAGLALSTAAVASAQEAYPDPTVATVVDGTNIITTVTDNGSGEVGGVPVSCINLGLSALDALPLASADPEDLDLFDVVNAAQWIDLQGGTSAESPEAVTDANAARAAVELGELEPGVYASVGACLTAELSLVSMAYDAPIFVPGGVGSVGQAIDLGSSALEMDGGSSMLMDFGSAMVGS